MRPRALPLLLVVLLAAGCFGGPAPGPDGGPPDGATPPTRDPSVDPVDPSRLRFDGARAYGLVEAQVLRQDGTVRHRVPGTPGNAEVAAWIADEMAALGYDVAWHRFNATYGCVETPMHNILAERAGASGDVVVFAAHYDTRPVADKDPDAARRDEPIAGANDGGSGVAVLLELARVLPRGEDGVRFVFFDGEDGGGYRGDRCTDWILGSRAYAASLSVAELARIRAVVVVDMVGDADLILPWEYQSREGPGGPVQEAMWSTAASLGYDQFVARLGHSILDDHVPFLDRDVPAIDVIHTIPGSSRIFPDTHHTHADDLDRVSAASLEAVGRTLEAWFHGFAGVSSATS